MEGGSAKELAFLCDIAELLQKNVARVTENVKESVGSLRDLIETLLVFLGAPPTDTRNAAMENNFEQLMDALQYVAESLKLFQAENQRLKAKPTNIVNGEIQKQFESRYEYLAPKFKSLLVTQKAFFQSVNSEFDGVSKKLVEKIETGGARKKPPVPAPRPRTAQPRMQPHKVHADGGKQGGVTFDDLSQARDQRSGSLIDPPGRRGLPPVPSRNGGGLPSSHSHDDMRHYGLDDRSKPSPTSIPTPSAPRPDGEAPPPSRPASTQVDFLPSQHLSATQTLLATVSALGGNGNSPVLVNRYKPHGGTDSPPATSSLPYLPTVTTSSPMPTRRPGAFNSHSASSSPTTGPQLISQASKHIRSNSAGANRDSGELGSSDDSPTQSRKNRIVPPIFEGDSGDWVLRTRQAKGTTGVDPELIQNRRAYWDLHQEQIVPTLQPSNSQRQL